MSKNDSFLLEESLAQFNVSGVENDVNAPHPRFSQYKPKPSSSSQEERRNDFLKRQNEKRYEYKELLRQTQVSGSISESTDVLEHMDCSKVKNYRRKDKKYQNQLMLSEWFVEVPEDLNHNWLMAICPVGKRSLVVACNGITKAYARSGHCVNDGFPSHLPGGYRKQTSTHAITVLDCIFDEKNRLYHVLDVICWNGHYVYDSDTEFRFYWLHSKLVEFPKLVEKSQINPMPFHELQKSTCNHKDIHSQIWSALAFDGELDGLLFYHKQVTYQPGVTPLIGWLKGFMVPEILNIDVPESWKNMAPADYTSVSKFLPKEVKRHQEYKEQLKKMMDE